MGRCGAGDAADDGTGRCRWCAALQVLGLDGAPSDDEIRSTYRLLAQVWHPDRFQTKQKLRQAAEEKLKEINRAYQFLTSVAGRSARCNGRRPENAPRQAGHASWVPSSDTEAREPERRSEPVIPPRARSRLTVHSGLLLRYCVILVGVAVAGVLVLQWLDSYLSSNPDTAKFYGEAKARVSADVAATLGESWNRVRQKYRQIPSGPAPSTANSFEKRSEAETAPGGARHGVRPTQPAVVKIRPYITADLTQQEVEEIQGQPTQATANKLVYQKSEIYFRANHLSGWKIDPSTPLRVKLWPDSAVDPDLRTFTVGSSKNEVLVVQGTPTVFSDDKFGYGHSEVYFDKNRVVGWRNDPTTVPLRVSSR
jgi:hypothetical protein